VVVGHVRAVARAVERDPDLAAGLDAQGEARRRRPAAGLPDLAAAGEGDDHGRRCRAGVEHRHPHGSPGPPETGRRVELPEDLLGGGAGGAHPERPFLGHAHAVAEAAPVDHDDGDGGPDGRREEGGEEGQRAHERSAHRT
jgi:hypothetical protein